MQKIKNSWHEITWKNNMRRFRNFNETEDDHMKKSYNAPSCAW